MKKAICNRKYTGPENKFYFKDLKIGDRIYFQVTDYEHIVPTKVTLEATITGLKQFGYIKKASIKVFDEKIGTMYIRLNQVIRILEKEKL